MATKLAFDPEQLRQEIADVIANEVKSYNVPSICVRFSIQDSVDETDSHEAHSSKRSYVKARLSAFGPAELLSIAAEVRDVYPSPGIDDILSAVRYADRPVSEIVRRDTLKTLNSVDTLFGERDLFEVLGTVFGNIFQEVFGFTTRIRGSLRDDIEQHYLKNPEDMSSEAMLIRCGALTCSQARFFSLIKEVLHPASRRDETQEKLAIAISDALARSGYLVSATGSDSGYPVFEVVEQRTQVSGAMKNLIFASTGPKPELVFRDAINNDVEITKNAEHVLVYDIPLPPQGALEWRHLRDWWATGHSVTEEEAKAQLYLRLRQSVRSARSPGEYAIFRSYYKLYAPILGDKLPTLLPQVFLHYDPYTKRQRGDEQFLARQRMDFLLMLEHGVRIVIEVDGRQHYAIEDGGGKWVADAQRYAEMTSEDRRLRLSGYEVYRFGGAEFSDVSMDAWTVGERSEVMLKSFFDRLLKKHRILQP